MVSNVAVCGWCVGRRVCTPPCSAHAHRDVQKETDHSANSCAGSHTGRVLQTTTAPQPQLTPPHTSTHPYSPIQPHTAPIDTPVDDAPCFLIHLLPGCVHTGQLGWPVRLEQPHLQLQRGLCGRPGGAAGDHHGTWGQRRRGRDRGGEAETEAAWQRLNVNELKPLLPLSCHAPSATASVHSLLHRLQPPVTFVVGPRDTTTPSGLQHLWHHHLPSNSWHS